MRKLRPALVLAVALLAGTRIAEAQRTTERFIPLGESPGVSGKLSTIGRIVAVDVERRRIHLVGPAGGGSVTVLETTSIWIDRHELGLAAEVGSFDDCQQDRIAEVKFADPDTRQFAEWIKLGTRPAAP